MSVECLVCGEENEAGALSCANCGAALKKDPISAAHWIIKCRCCGHIYDVDGPSSRIEKCDYCYDDIDSERIFDEIPQEIKPVDDSSKTTRTALVLSESRNKITIHMCQGGILGRSGDIEPNFFMKFDSVSREHCRIALVPERNAWIVEHIGHSLPTILNGKPLQNGVKKPLRVGDKLRLGNILFFVDIQNGQDMDADNNKTKCNERKWVITCPVCRKQYFGDSASFRVSTCTGSCSFDDVDKYEIANELPQLL